MKSFTCNLVSFNATISDIALNICKILKVEKNDFIQRQRY